MDPITSPSNPKIKQVRALRQRKARQESGLFLVEGIHPVGEAVEAGAPLESIFYAPNLLSSDFARQLVRSQEMMGLPCYATSPAVFESIADKDNPQGLLAVARMRPGRLEALHPQNCPWGVALVSPQDPGNIGAILRTIDAAGASALLLLDSSADPYAPGAVRASMGALFRHPLIQVSFGEFVDWARRYDYAIYGTSAHARTDYRALAYRWPCILLMGSEREGLSPGQAAACHELVSLPMHGRVTSLNLAVATGVMLYAMLAQRSAP